MAKTLPHFVKNVQKLKKFQPILAKYLEKDFPEICQYQVTTAKNGMPTLAMVSGGKTLQVHSRYDPEKEAIDQIVKMNFQNPKILIIFGFGLGYHIKAALDAVKKENFFVILIEKDPNVIKLAMQHVDLAEIITCPKVYWTIGVADEDSFAVLSELIKTASTGLQILLKTTVVFDHPAISQIHGEHHKLMLRQFREAAQRTILNYGNCPHDSLMGVENIMKNLGVILRNPGVTDLYGLFKGVPGIIVSTGPTLDKNIKHLVGVEDRCVMIAADSAVWPLLRNGITPHAFASLERVIETVETYKTIPEEKMKEIFLAATPVIRPEGYEAWKGPTFITYRDFAHFKWIDIPKGTLPIGMSCSNMAFKLLEAFGCNPIILVGQDCSFASIEKTHASGTHGRLIDPLAQENLYKIKGNYDDWVWTDMYFDLFRKGFVSDVAAFKGQVINCTAGGAMIEGTHLMPLEEAVKKYCTSPVQAFQKMQKRLRYPSEKEIRQQWKKMYKIIQETLVEVKDVIEFCDRGVQKVDQFELELETKGFFDQDHFLKDFPNERLDEVHAGFLKDRAQIFQFGKYFLLYLMHIVQMILVRFEMDFNELPSLCNDMKRCKLQSIRMMKKWYPTIRDVCKVSLKLLEESFEDLKKEFGEPV